MAKHWMKLKENKIMTKNKAVVPLKYEDVKDTYLSAIKENLNLAINLQENSNKPLPYDPTDVEPFYVRRARHIQSMSIIGLATEYLIKLILLKRKYIINKVKYIRNIKKNMVVYETNLIDFSLAVKLFNDSNNLDYYSNLGRYKFETSNFPNYDELYFGKKEINPTNCLELIVSIRNNYMHHAGPRGEQNGIIWYIFNFVIWISKNEHPDYFENVDFIGNAEIRNLFIKN